MTTPPLPIRTIVLKFGSSILSDESRFPAAAHEIYCWVREGWRVVAVVSAIGRSTDHLLARARAISDDPQPEALAALLGTGETASASLLWLALDRAGVTATVLDPARLKLRTEGPALEADPVSLDVSTVVSELDHGRVVVVPGFVGRSADDRPTLLGRGGSDLTAVFIAGQLGARCRLLKDVPWVFDRDPARGYDDSSTTESNAARPRPFATLTFNDALALGGRIVQPRALELARQQSVPIEVAALFEPDGTRIGTARTTFAHSAPHAARPLRVGLLGLGTVGLGTYRALVACPERFDVVAAAVRSPAKYAELGLPEDLVTGNPWEVLESDAEVIVEAIGGLDPAFDFAVAALRSGRHFVTANKRLIAERGPELQAIASANGARLAFSACVGGGTPIIEAARQAAAAGPLRSITCVLNGTTNFILQRIDSGSTVEESIAEARQRGLTEADPTSDLDGSDVAHKLIILAREAFGAKLRFESVQRRCGPRPDEELIRFARSRKRVVRQVATLTQTRAGIRAVVDYEILGRTHPLASTTGEENAAIIEPVNGSPLIIRGRGAGRWPTAQSIVADLIDLLAQPAPEEALLAG